MGIWHMPQTKTQKNKLAKKLAKLRKLEDEILELLGDDITLDHLGLAIERIEKFCTHITVECMHPAFYVNGDVGVCKLCRSNLQD